MRHKRNQIESHMNEQQEVGRCCGLALMGRYLLTSWLKSCSPSPTGNRLVPCLFSSAHKRQTNESHNKLVTSILTRRRLLRLIFPSGRGVGFDQSESCALVTWSRANISNAASRSRFADKIIFYSLK